MAAPSHTSVQAVRTGLGNEQFIAKGRRIGTPRLVKELARNYGIVVDWLDTSLLNVTGGIPAWKARVESAYATPDTQVPMTDALDALCVVAEKMLAEPTDGMKIRLARNKVTADAITNLRSLATSARDAKREADAVAPAPAVTQSDVDVWDGIAISFFEQFVDAVENGHRVDPAIPAPSIIGLRSWFGRTSRKNEKPDEPGATDATDAPTNG